MGDSQGTLRETENMVCKKSIPSKQKEERRPVLLLHINDVEQAIVVTALSQVIKH